MMTPQDRIVFTRQVQNKRDTNGVITGTPGYESSLYTCAKRTWKNVREGLYGTMA